MAIFKRKDENPKSKQKATASKPAASATQTKGQKMAKDAVPYLKAQALKAKAKAAKSKAASSKLRSENTPQPLASGQPLARFQRSANKAMGLSGKQIMDEERNYNKDERAMYGLDKKNKTRQEKADSAFITGKFSRAVGLYSPIEYKQSAKKATKPDAMPKPRSSRKK